MGYQTVRLAPGINVQMSPTLNEAGWSACGFIRFKDGLPQKLGGWAKYINVTVGSVIRALHAWQDLSANDWLAIGAHTSLNVVENGSSIQDITPQTRSADVNEDFSTTSGSTTVTIVAASSNLSVYSSIYLSTPVSVGGIVLYGGYTVVTVLSANSFTITASAAATATVANGGAVPSLATTSGSSLVSVTLNNHGNSVGSLVDFKISTTVGGITVSGIYPVFSVTSANIYVINVNQAASSTTSGSMNAGSAHFIYYISIGPPAIGSGYGIGTYGTGTFGIGAASAFTAGTAITPANWTLDNWGEILIATPEDGAVYYWRPGSGFTTASVVATGPFFNTGSFISMPAQILVVYGSVGVISQVRNPLMVRWSDVSDFTVWYPLSTNQAGSYVIPEGSKIVGGIQANQRALLFTDLAVWSMEYVGPPDIFGFNKVSDGCGLIGKHAVTTYQDNVYWMSDGNFYVLSGQGVQSLPCPVWDAVFQDLDSDYAYKCVAASNSLFDEITFYYPSLSGGTHEIDSYVKYNVDDQVWDYGSLDRTAWIDQSVLGEPIGGSSTGYVFQHETSTDADGAAMVSSITSGWFMLTEGDPVAFVDLLLPDFKYGTYAGSSNAQLGLTVYSADFPADTPITHGPYAVTSLSKWISTRVRGRMVMLKISSSDIGSFWRLENLRYRGAIDGRRGG